MVGYRRPGSNDNLVQNPHHKASACPPWPQNCNWETFKDSTGPTTHILYGAIVGGPRQDDSHNDKRSDYRSNEVTVDYNAGFTGLVAGMKMVEKIGQAMGAVEINRNLNSTEFVKVGRKRRGVSNFKFEQIDWKSLEKTRQ